VHLYSSVAHRTGSAEALALAHQMSAWHDEMVVHARAVARGGPVECDESCPHARAIQLWRAARRLFGEAADRLVFLKSAAAESHALRPSPIGLHDGTTMPSSSVSGESSPGE
jgi:hypothetical protein